MPHREPDENRDNQSSENWLGDLVKPAPKEERHWLHGLVSPSEPAVERESRTLNLEDLPPHLKARLDEIGHVIFPQERSTPPAPLQAEVQITPQPARLEPVAPPSKAPSDQGTLSPKRIAPPPRTLSEQRKPSIPPSQPARRGGALPGLKFSRPQSTAPRSKQIEAPRVMVKLRLDAKSLRQRLLIYRAVAVMMESGLQLFSCFEFLAEQAETPEVREACLRTAGELASGRSLSTVARSEPVLFSETSARMLEVGMRSGRLVTVLARLAEDEEQQWALRQRIWGKLFYPLTLALLALGAAVLLPPLALSSLLQEVVTLTDDPPRITLLLLDLSSAISSPVTLSAFAFFTLLAFYLLSDSRVRDRIKGWERYVWQLPWLGEVFQVAYSARFLQVFALTHEVGLPANQCLKLAAEATGSRVISERSELMVTALMEGETLSESIARGNFLPAIAYESVEAGEQVAKLSDMMRRAAEILLTDLDYRIDTALKLMEPALLAVLGLFVGVFALGCLLPILKLTETL